MSIFKHLLKPLLSIIILQLVLMPLAPVLAQELNQSTSTVVEAADPAVVPVVAPMETPVVVEPVVSTTNETVASSIISTTSVTIVPERILEPQIVSTSTEVTNTAPTNEAVLVVSSTPASTPEKLPEYSQIMRRLNRLDQTKEVQSDEFERFIQSEKDRLDKLDLDSSNKSAYFDQLDKQLKKLRNEPPTFIEKVIDRTKEILGLDSRSKVADKEAFRIPAKPAEFKFNTDEFTIQTLQSAVNEQPTPQLLDMFNEAFKIDRVSADSQYLPTINDVKADNEAIINSEIQDLARSLNNNPVKILNYVRQNISYEPYFGAKKGSLGCLREKVCNDFDTSSLTISLLRASGIPARYKKSVVAMSADQIKNLLGVDELKTAYLAWAMNKVPVYTISAGTFNGKAEDYDFSQETALALEWVFVEAYYDYDERGANLDNILSFSSATTTADVQTLLQGYTKKQWIPIDALVKTYNRTKNEIVHDTANFNTQNFWNGFLQYSGTLSPLQKYTQDLKNTTGKDISNANFQSTNVGTTDTFQILPPTLPYYTHTAEVGGSLIQPVAWSYIPDNYRAQVKISLLKDSDKSIVFEHSFFGSEINNADISLAYEGATNVDKQTIDSYGGIHATPAALVNIKPYILAGYARYDTNNTVKIGDQLILHFDYTQSGMPVYSDEKFSIAGNSEGIAVTLSRIQTDPNLDTNSKILLAGNSALASKYLQRVQESSDTLQKALDYRSNVIFSRAVITQNRILSEVDGSPTTFDFKGLSIDASSYINDWSNRGIFKNHRQDFRLLWGIEASYYEGQLFNDITGLEGISTVKGLQYAYAHPADYTVYNITKTNENIIDTLSLTPNTKQNMHTAVQAGNTVVTPNKAITDGAFTGILYIVLLPEGCATYAIGEQTQMNGGWTASQMLNYVYIDQSSQERQGFLKQFGDNSRYYFEDKKIAGLSCKISDAEYNLIIKSKDWSTSLGYPCAVNNLKFGNVNHSYLLASNGSYFSSPDIGYGYWINEKDVINKINQYISNLPKVDDEYNFSFTSLLGTYMKSICTSKSIFSWNCDNNSYETIYYSPDNTGGHVHRLQKGFLKKANNNDKVIIKILGFPTSDEQPAAPSPFKTKGVYQNFVNGQMYFSSDVYYIAGVFEKIYNNYGGSGGELGFPDSDPINGKNGHVIQIFENEKQFNSNPNFKALGAENGIISLQDFKKFQCDLNNWYFNDYTSPIWSPLIIAKGFLDTIGYAISDLIELTAEAGGIIGNLVVHPINTYNKTVELGKILSQINISQALDVLKNAGNTAIINEWNESIGPNGCMSRRAYITGRILGNVVLLGGPIVGKLKAVERAEALRVAERIGGLKMAGFVEKWMIYRSDVELAVKSLEVPGKFTKENIAETLLGKFNKESGKFQGEGLHSARTLKAGMDTGVLEVWNVNKTKKYTTYADVLKDSGTDGFFEVRIRKTTGWSEIKTFLPEQWSDKEMVDAIVEASNNRLFPPNDNQFLGIITKKGIAIKIRGYFENANSEYIKHGFRDP